jgi:hypothetical protein
MERLATNRLPLTWKQKALGRNHYKLIKIRSFFLAQQITWTKGLGRNNAFFYFSAEKSQC